jgi:catechol 2,3-dioxygenase-like lactoylglutathione lyase family enzyme
MIAKRAHHVSFAVADLERSREFYERVLGLEPIPRPELGIPGVWYGAGNVELHLIATPAGLDTGRPAEKLSPLANHTAFAIDDYAATLAHLRGHGLEVLEMRPGVGPQMWIRDPDGNVIELVEAPGERA